MQILLQNSASYRGILMYVQGANNDKIRNGNFEIPKGFKSNKSNCDADLTVGENGVITHSSPDPKPGNTIFSWTPDRCEDSILRAVVVGDARDLWQILPDVKITCDSASSISTGTTNSTNVYATDAYDVSHDNQTSCNDTVSPGVDTYSAGNYTVPTPAPTVTDTTYNGTMPSNADAYTNTTVETPCNDTVSPGVDTYSADNYTVPIPAPTVTDTTYNGTMPSNADTYTNTTVETPCNDTVSSGAEKYSSTNYTVPIENECTSCNNTISSGAATYNGTDYTTEAPVEGTPCNNTVSSGAETYNGTNYTAPAPTVNDTVPLGEDIYNSTDYGAPISVPTPVPVPVAVSANVNSVSNTKEPCGCNTTNSSDVASASTDVYETSLPTATSGDVYGDESISVEYATPYPTANTAYGGYPDTAAPSATNETTSNY
jgi:hypothetical protein